MKKFVTNVIILVVFWLVASYITDTWVLKLERKQAELRQNFSTQSEINTELQSTNNELNSIERISSIAKENLNMVYAKSDSTQSSGTLLTYVKEVKGDKEYLFSLIDYITPSAEAITRNSTHID